MADLASTDHAKASAFGDHWRERGYVMQDAADLYGATEIAPDLWIVAGHALNGSVAGVAVVCPLDCSERRA